MARQLSKRETKVLEIIAARTSKSTPLGASGPDIAATMNSDPLERWDASPAGAHQTAASLARKLLIVRAGTSKLRWYRVTDTGLAALRGDQGGRWVAHHA